MKGTHYHVASTAREVGLSHSTLKLKQSEGHLVPGYQRSVVRPNVRVEAKAEVGLPDWRVGFALKNGHAATASACRFCAKLGSG
jgi:hypothetical protein